jgi:secondary thiamine-phosphate synthase enzyme
LQRPKYLGKRKIDAMVHTAKIVFDSEGNWFSLNITEQVRAIAAQSGIRAGAVLVFFQHSTGSVLIIEHEAGFLVDLEDTLERMAPSAGQWAHHLRDYDRNGAAHVRSAIMPPSITVPLVDGDLALGEYQDILVVDMQPERKPRSVLVQVMGD